MNLGSITRGSKSSEVVKDMHGAVAFGVRELQYHLVNSGNTVEVAYSFTIHGNVACHCSNQSHPCIQDSHYCIPLQLLDLDPSLECQASLHAAINYSTSKQVLCKRQR
jgi:hypothetical protein